MANRARIAVLVETSKTYGRGIIEGISQYSRDHRQWSIFINERGLDSPLPEWIEQRAIDGILLRTSSSVVLDEVKALKIPTVSLGEQYDPDVPIVHTHDSQLAILAAQEFLNRGFKTIGFAGIRGTVWSDIRKKAIADYLNKSIYYSCCDPSNVDDGLLDWPSHQLKLTRWLSELPKPAGIVAAYDVIGVRVLDACSELGIAIPAEVAVIGIDDDQFLCELANPPLSSVAHSLREIGYRACSLLDQIMRGDAVPNEPILIEPQGICARQSSDIFAIDDPLIAKAIQYIRDHACDGINVNDVLQQIPLTRATLTRRFEKYIGHSAKEEIMRLQMNRVKELLSETDFNLVKIANLSGYNHVEHMSMIFKEKNGISPGKYRARTKN